MSVIFLALVSKHFGKSIGLAYFFVSDSNKVLAVTTGISVYLLDKH